MRYLRTDVYHVPEAANTDSLREALTAVIPFLDSDHIRYAVEQKELILTRVLTQQTSGAYNLPSYLNNIFKAFRLEHDGTSTEKAKNLVERVLKNLPLTKRE